MSQECEWCGEELTQEEINEPVAGQAICEDCYHEHYEFTCSRCCNYEHIDCQHCWLVVFEPIDDFDKRDSEIQPGIYEIVDYPYYGGMMLGGAWAVVAKDASQDRLQRRQLFVRTSLPGMREGPSAEAVEEGQGVSSGTEGGDMSEPKRRDYIIIEAAEGSPRIQDADTFLTRWPDTMNFVEDYLDSIEPGEKVTLSFTAHKWTQEEFEAYCVENDIDPGCFGETQK
jgi:hypothetical protein